MATQVQLVLNANDVGRRAMVQYVADIHQRAQDMRPAWPGVLLAIYLREAELFRDEGVNQANTAGWGPLSDRPIRYHKINGLMVGYKTWKARHYPGRKILELTGRLRRMLTGVSADAYEYRGVRRLIFGTDYGSYAGVPNRPRSGRDRLTGDLGGITAEGRQTYFPMVERPPIQIDDPYQIDIADAVCDYVLDAVRLTP